jgi:putative ABC transport system permease protein
VSHGYWLRSLGGRVDVIGQTVRIDGISYVVVGVMPPGFSVPFKFLRVNKAPEIWTPFPPELHKQAHRGNHIFMAAARLKPRITVDQAQADVSVVMSNLGKQYPDCAGFRSLVVPLHDSLSGHLRPTLLPLLGAVGFILLIACANVANLLLARSGVRSRELALRSAIGATRLRVIGQLLTESLLLALLGGLVGILTAVGGSKAINGFLASTGLDVPSATVDGTVLLFAVAISLLTGVIFGLVPALQAAGTDTGQVLKEGGRSSSGGLGHNRLKNLMVIIEIALSLVLLVGAGLLIKSFIRVWQLDPGFSRDRILTMTVPISNMRFREWPKRAAAISQLVDQVAAMPGVQSAAIASNLPSDGGWVWAFTIEGRPAPAPGQEPNEVVQFVTPRYFGTLGIPLKRGRGFSDQDTVQSPPVAVINEAMARKYWGGKDPLGERINPDGTARTIVGVVGDIRQDGLMFPPKPQFYFSLLQTPLGDKHLVVRTATDPLSLAPAIRQEAQSLDETGAVADIRSLEGVLSLNLASQRVVMLLMGIFAVVALTLAAIGIYGVVAYAVAQRRHEFGIRLALGARPRTVVLMVLCNSLVVTAAGTVLGGAAALALTRILSSQLSGVSPTDPLVFLGVVVLLSSVALLSAVIPARRAARVDPMELLRSE